MKAVRQEIEWLSDHIMPRTTGTVKHPQALDKVDMGRGVLTLHTQIKA